jgi:hypothetical protein
MTPTTQDAVLIERAAERILSHQIGHGDTKAVIASSVAHLRKTNSDEWREAVRLAEIALADRLEALSKTATAEPEGWKMIESAPKGTPSEDVGCRDVSEWFSAKSVDAQVVVTIRRRAWPHEDQWQDKRGTIYSANYFDLWMPLPASPTVEER